MPYAPALLLLLFAAWAGTFEGAASAAGATAGTAALLLALVWAGLRLDPLGLGRGGRYLVAGLLVALAASAWASPVPRAGLEGLLLLPAWLTLPAATALCWWRRDRRRRGLLAVSAVVVLIALWALLDWTFTDSPRPSQPLGHHNFLALWLVTLLPLAALPVRGKGGGRWMGIVAVTLGLAALLATRSLAGIVALFVPLVGFWRLSRRQPSPRKLPRVLAVVAVLVVLAIWVLPRGLQVISGQDPSTQARAVYLRAGMEGLGERPLTGWGPGATAWTLNLFLDPVPGVNPRSEIVGQLHALPLEIAYEMGWPGLLLVLAIVAVFILRRWRETHGTEDPTTLAALWGLGAALVASLGTTGLTVTALPVAWGVTAGAALAASTSQGEAWRPHPRRRTAALVVAAVLLVALLPWLRARHLYETAANAPELEQTERRLAAAVELDPRFPLYRARWAWAVESAREARRAATDAVGVAPLWLQAGVLGLESGEPWARDALRRACGLDPFSPFAAFFLVRSHPEASQAPVQAARSLLLEPRLVGAVLWEGNPELRAAVSREIARWPGVDPGLRNAVRSALDGLAPAATAGEVASLVLTLEAQPDRPFALHAFRRPSWPARLAPIPVRPSVVRAVELPSAAQLPETGTDAFGTLRGCR